MFPALLSLALLSQAAAAPPRAPLRPASDAPLARQATDLSPEEEPSDDGHRLARIPLELLGGAAFGVSVGFLGTLVACALNDGHAGDDDAIPSCFTAFLVLAPLSTPVGTWLIGGALDGDGTLTAAYEGLLGAGAAVGALALAMGDDFDRTPGPPMAAFALAAIGPTVGYELSSHARASKVAVVPSLSPKSPGLALVGSF